MPSTCDFQLSNPNGVYYSGQMLYGTIVLNTTKEKEIRNVRLRFVGEAKVNWTETERHRDHDGEYRSRTVHFRGNEVYVDNTTLVRDEGILPPGTHTYTFNIALPISCPTSCEGKYGHIRYALWLVVDRPLRFDNEFSRPLTVLRIVDLNLNPAFRVPLQTEEISSIGCWPCASGKIMYTLRIPFGAYAAGQTLHYSLTIQNESMTEITGYKVKFYENLTFTAHRPYHKSREQCLELATQKYVDTCLRQSNRIFEGAMILPSLPPDTEGHCIIRVQHSLEFEINVDGCHSNSTITVPIVIGNVPIRESMSQMEQPSIQENHFDDILPSAPMLPDDENNKDMPPAYGDLKPPSFEEAERSHSPFQDPDYNEKSQVIGFRPSYPMYPAHPPTNQ